MCTLCWSSLWSSGNSHGVLQAVNYLIGHFYEVPNLIVYCYFVLGEPYG